MYSGSCCADLPFAYGAFTLSGPVSQTDSARLAGRLLQSEPHGARRHGLGSSAFARRYLRNRCFFLFLRLLRCFSSPGSPPYAMCSHTNAWVLPMQVSPFRNPRVIGYLLLTAAYRSLSRLSSALSAKASALCSFLLDLVSLSL